MTHRTRLLATLSPLLTLLVGTVAADPPTPRFTIIDLGTLGGTDSFASAINARGQVVGGSGTGKHVLNSTPSGRGKQKSGALDTHAFIWDGGTMRAIILPQTDLLSTSYGINDLGEVVGIALTPNNSGRVGGYVGYLWRQGQVIELPMFSALGINDSGQIIGDLRTPIGQTGLRQPSGEMSILAPLKGYLAAVARSVNNMGWVVGASIGGPAVSGMAASHRATLWKNGRALGLGTYNSEAEGVNNAGEVVGWASRHGERDNPRRGGGHWAFVWRGGRLRWLFGGETSSWAQSINDEGQVVGWIETGSGPRKTVAVLWQSGRMYELDETIGPNSGWDLVGASSINSRGQIVGGGMHNGHKRAFLLTPVGPYVFKEHKRKQ